MDETLLWLADVVCTPFALLLKGIGIITRPISGLIFGHWYMKLLLALVLFAISHHWKFDSRGKRIMLQDLNWEVKLSAYPLSAALYLGLKSVSAPLYKGFTAMTWFNFLDWDFDVKIFFIVFVIILPIAVIQYWAFESRHAIRFLFDVASFLLLGSAFTGLFITLGMLADEIGGVFLFILQLFRPVLTVILGFLEALQFVTLFYFFKPMARIMEQAKEMERKEKREREKAYTSSSGSGKDDSDDYFEQWKSNCDMRNMPNIIYDSANNQWHKMHAYEASAVYSSPEHGDVTLFWCNIESKRATGNGKEFHWW